jgi:hypothetical protein
LTRRPDGVTRGKRKQPERLSGKTPNGDAIVRPATIHEIAELHRNDVATRKSSNNGIFKKDSRWQAGGKARFIYLPPGLRYWAQYKSSLIEVDTLQGNTAQAKVA